MSRHTAFVIVSSVILTMVASARADEPLTAAVPDPSWDAVFDRADGWIGGDAIYTTPLPPGDVLWLFADSYIGRVRDGRRQPGTRMVNNALARHAISKTVGPPDPQMVRFQWGSTPDDAKPKAWIEPDPALRPAGQPGAEEWYWVADGIVAPRATGGDRLVLFLWLIARTGNEVMGFRAAGNSLAIVDNPAVDWSNWRPKQFAITHAIPAPVVDTRRKPEIVWGSEVVRSTEPGSENALLVFGYRQPQQGATQLVLARVSAEAIEQMDQWQFRTADHWSANTNNLASLAEGLTTEFSVTRMGRGDQPLWVLVQSEPWFGTKILVRTARSAYGPWSSPKPIYQVPDIQPAKKHFTYAAKAHPELSRAGELLVSYVVNSFDFGESSTNASIYRPRFVRVPASVLPEPPAEVRN
ncbi:MAG TPA: hypothetical protein VGG64_12175 [Pirellulales bacterium]|jgi:hypothetical protein